jgi:hypothetical protein
MTELPDDDNGRILRLLREKGDALSEPRVIEFQFIFPERSQSLDFAREVPEQDYEVCLSYFDERAMWDVEVKIYMIPSHSEITRIEADLSARAARFGGQADGWCCIVVKNKNDGKNTP